MTCPNPCYTDYSYNKNYYYDNTCNTGYDYACEDPCLPRRRCKVICERPSLFESWFTPTYPTYSSYSSNGYSTCPRVVRRGPVNGGGAVLMLMFFLIIGVMSLATNPTRSYYC